MIMVHSTDMRVFEHWQTSQQSSPLTLPASSGIAAPLPVLSLVL